MAHKYMPVSLTMKSRRCLIVGGGQVALRKIDILLDYDTEITVIAPEADEKIKYYAERKLLKLEQRPYNSPEAGKYNIVIAACDDQQINETVCENCRSANVPVNVVDNPKLCDFIFPAVVRRNSLSVAVSTDAMAPFLSGHLRLILENIFPNNWGKIADLAIEFRAMVKTAHANNAEKKAVAFSKFLDADWKKILKDNSAAEIKTLMEQMITS